MFEKLREAFDLQLQSCARDCDLCLLLVVLSSSSTCLRFRITWLVKTVASRMDQAKQGCSCDRKQNKTNNVRGASVVGYFARIIWMGFRGNYAMLSYHVARKLWPEEWI